MSFRPYGHNGRDGSWRKGALAYSATALWLSAAEPGRAWASRERPQEFFRPLHQLDFIAFGRIDKGKAAPVFLPVRPVGVAVTEAGQVLSKVFQTVDFKSEMSQVRLDLNGTAL